MAKKSPFPGMDPYLERHWGDVHHRLVVYACDQLQEHLPEAPCARIEERVYVESEAGCERNEGFVEIRERDSRNRLITIIEVLGAAKETGTPASKEYLRKQREILISDISLVEIDLLRGGRRGTAAPREAIPDSHQTPYHVCIRRAWYGDRFEVYPIPLRQRLPVIPIPLRRKDADARLDLQALLDQAYQMGRYDDLDYARKLDPPLSRDDAKWAGDLIKGR